MVHLGLLGWNARLETLCHSHGSEDLGNVKDQAGIHCQVCHPGQEGVEATGRLRSMGSRSGDGEGPTSSIRDRADGQHSHEKAACGGVHL